jgi:hypothetical protein
MKWRESQPPLWDELGNANSAIQVATVIMAAYTACTLLFASSFVMRFAAVGAVRMQFDATRAVAATRQSLENCAAARFAENMRTFAIVNAAAVVWR